jgi:tryptophan 2,3-dioxygenase
MQVVAEVVQTVLVVAEVLVVQEAEVLVQVIHQQMQLLVPLILAEVQVAQEMVGQVALQEQAAQVL